jgi:hypothetical protein
MLANAELIAGEPRATDDLAAALKRVLVRESALRTRPDPAEISSLDVRVDTRNRGFAGMTDVRYPMRTLGEVVVLLRRLDHFGLAPLNPSVVADLGPPEAPIGVPRLAGYGWEDLGRLDQRPTP